LRILYLADIRFPLERANGIQTMETAYALAERRHEVTLGVRPDPVRPEREPFAFYGREPTQRLRFARMPVSGVEPCRRAAYLAQAVIRAFCARRRFDVVFTRDLGVAGALLRLPGPLRPSLVYESHGYAPVFADTMPELVSGARRGSRRKIRRLSKRESRVWERAEGYVTTTRTLASELTERFGSRPRLLTVSNGVRLPADRVFPAHRSGRPSVVAYAGHLYPWKGGDVFVRALSSLPETRGLIVGGRQGDADFSRVRQLVRELGLAERVTVTGLVPRADVPERLSSADVLVLPTVATPSARYTSPLKLFEYMASGRPIVASDLEPIREVLTDGQNARLVPPGEPAALAAAVRELLADPAQAEQLARTAFEQVSSYSWSRRADRIAQLLTDVVRAS
jgi:glycosyltransferase involved in cell wall biosynthesis